jgi:uncharacterized membrane protein SirB2
VIEFYGEIRFVHILAVVASGSVLLLRGLAVGAGRQSWALAAPVRYLSYAVDTTLLTAALMLFTLLPSVVFSNGWLATKLALLPAYVGLGWLALRSAAGTGRRLAYLAAAGAVYGLMFAIARTHDPLGPVRLLAGG